MKGRLMGKYGVLGSFLLVLLVRIPFDLKPFHNVDEGVLATLANIISNGGLVYRDGWCHRGPLLSYVYAGIFYLFGRNNMIAVHLITTLVIGVETFLLYRLSLFFFKKKIAIVAAFFFAFFSTFGYSPFDTLAANVEIWMNLFILSSLCVFIKALKTDDRRDYFLSGLIMGLAALTKQIAYFQYLFLVVALWFVPVWWRENERKPVRAATIHSLMIALGMLTPLVGILGYYGLKGAMGEFISLYFSYNFYYLRSFYESRMDFNLTRRIATALGNIVIVNFPPKRPLLLYGSSLVGFFAYLRHVKRIGQKLPSHPSPQLFLFFSWLFFSILPLVALGRPFGHYFIQILPIVSVIAAAFIVQIFEESVHTLLKRSALVLLTAGLLVYPIYCFMNEGPFRENSVLCEVSNYIQNHSKPADTIFLWGWETELYVMANRPNASRFIFCSFLTDQTPGALKGIKEGKNLGYRNAVDLWTEDLRKARPKFIIDSHRGHFFYGAYPLTRYPEVWHFIGNNYHLVTVTGNYVIYEWVAR